MNKSDLIEQVVSIAGVPRKEAEDVVNLIFDEMTAALVRDERIEIRGFGSFVSKRYRARTGRNPRSGETIHVPPKRLPVFKVGKELRERVDNGKHLHPHPGGVPAAVPRPSEGDDLDQGASAAHGEGGHLHASEARGAQKV